MTDSFPRRAPDEDELDSLDEVAPDARLRAAPAAQPGSFSLVPAPASRPALSIRPQSPRPVGPSIARAWQRADKTLVIAAGLVTAIGIATYAFRNVAVLVGLLIVGPLVAATGTTPRRTAYVAGYAVTLGVVLGVPAETFGTLDHAIRCAVLAVAGGLSVWAAGLRAEREVALRRMARVAEVAQRAILRPPPPELGSVGFAARYLSATEEALIGGDLYETAYTPYGVRVIVGDVRGKGLDAVGLAAAVLGRFREVVFAAPTLVEVTRAIDEHVTASAGPEEFVTAVLVEFPDEGGVRVVNCGHHPPMRIGADEVEFLRPERTTVPLGMGPRIRVDPCTFETGDRLLLYTDGLVEARDPNGRYFPLDDVSGVLRLGCPQRALDALLQHLVDHVGGRLNDDLAVLMAERLHT